jgi:5-methylcytosine-specific restriction endonuclease McrA
MRRKQVNEQFLLRQLTRRAWFKQRGLCYHCQDPVPLSQVTGDHFPLARYQGGMTRHGNIVASCYECNNFRNQETNRRGGKLNITVGDTTPHSPFEVLAHRSYNGRPNTSD